MSGKPVFDRDYTPSLNHAMEQDAHGLWRDRQQPVDLSLSEPARIHYVKTRVEVPAPEPAALTDYVVDRVTVNERGLQALVAYRRGARACPTMVICVGGPNVPPPDLTEPDSLYRYLLAQGWTLVVPLRRGVMTVSEEWEKALEGHYGEYDVADTLEAVRCVQQRCEAVDKERMVLYGGSYGGYVAQLIAGRENSDRLFKAVIAHCGVYDLRTYPRHTQGRAEETMETYAGTTDPQEYSRRVEAISPQTYVQRWSVPVLLIHHLHDTSTWVGQSVAAYNEALSLHKTVRLIIVNGPHTYAIPQREALFGAIARFAREAIENPQSNESN